MSLGGGGGVTGEANARARLEASKVIKISPPEIYGSILSVALGIPFGVCLCTRKHSVDAASIGRLHLSTTGARVATLLLLLCYHEPDWPATRRPCGRVRISAQMIDVLLEPCIIILPLAWSHLGAIRAAVCSASGAKVASEPGHSSSWPAGEGGAQAAPLPTGATGEPSRWWPLFSGTKLFHPPLLHLPSPLSLSLSLSVARLRGKWPPTRRATDDT